MISQDRRKQCLTALAAAAFCTLIVFGIIRLAHDLFGNLENLTIDYRFRLRGKRPVDPRIVLIDIDEKSIAAIGRWPWDRGIHAEMIDILFESGAKVIGYDILFKQPSLGAGEAGDKALVSAIQKAGNVILPTGFELEDSGSHSLLRVLREVGPFSALREAAAGIGHISSNRDPDGIIRRVPLSVDNNGSRFPSFSMAMLAEDSRTHSDKMIPVDAQGMMQINYAGLWVETFDHYSFIDILEAWRERGAGKGLKEALNGKMIIISNTATGYDLKPIPLESDYPGGGIHASTLNTLLSGHFLKALGSGPSFVMVFLLATGTALLSIGRRGWMGFASGFLPLFITLLAAILLFSKGIILPVLFPLITLPLSYMTILFYENIISRNRLLNLNQEKTKIVADLHKVNQTLELNRKELEVKRLTLSATLHEMRSEKNQKNDDLQTISSLRDELEEADERGRSLLGEKRALQKKIDGFSPENFKQGTKLEAPWETLSSEARRYRIIAQSSPMLEIIKRIKKAAITREPILILGETGTGKELIAEAIHALSPRSKKKDLVTVNMAAIPEALFESTLFGHKKGTFSGADRDRIGKFQEADGGTIFLDEIGEIPLSLQVKLLRVLETGAVDQVGATQTERVDVRVIAATNRNLRAELDRKTFREDLYFRLDGISVQLPPLRERKEDLGPLVEYLIQNKCYESGIDMKDISQGAMERIKQHPWPGNVRELKRVISKGIILSEGNTITEADLELDSASLTPGQSKDNKSPASESMDLEGTIINDKDLSDTDFLSLLRKNKFRIKDTAAQLKVNYLAVGSRFKGIALKTLDEQHGDVEATAEMLSGGGGESNRVEAKIRKYHQNLIESVRDFSDCEEAIQKNRLLLRNVKKKYHPSMERLIRKYFNSRG